MKKDDIREFSLDNISRHADPHSIKNFILSDIVLYPPKIPFRKPLVFDGFIFGICLKGKGKILVNSKEYKITPNTLFLLLPHHLIKLVEKTEDFLITTLYFPIDFIIGILSPRDFDALINMNRAPFIQISDEERENLIEMYSFTLKQYNRVGHTFKEEIMKALLYILFLEVSFIDKRDQETNKINSTGRQEEIIERFFKLLIRHYKKERTVSFYADKMCLSPKYLSSAIKKTTGHPVSKWIDELVIIYAKNLLITTDMTVLQISEALNFPNPSFFGHAFKKNTGITPLKYRKKCNK